MTTFLLPCTARAAAPPPDVAGLWGNETVFGPPVEGALTIDARVTPWRASIDGMTATVERHGDRIAFALPGGQGRFRGRLHDDADIDGFWIQPASDTLGSAYATPVALSRRQAHAWTGEVRPQPERVTQYLLIRRTADGTLEAFLRNPEFNFGRGHRYVAQVKGDALLLTDPSRKGWALHGTLDEETGQLRIDWQGIGVFGFTRRDRDQATGFYARTPADIGYVYRPPLPGDDGWPVAALRDVGINAKAMARLVEHIVQADATLPDAPQVHGLLVARHGKLVLETYFHGYDRDTPHDTRSAGKTFASLLVGLAMDHGAPLTPATKVITQFPQYPELTHADPRKQAITVADLMSMTSGLACDDNDGDSPGNEDVMQGQHKQPDWYRYTLDLPMARTPGADDAVYCSAGINLLGGVIGHATGRWLPQLFQDWIAGPLQMRDYHINLMPDGDAYLAGGIHMRPRDLLKLGQLYLDGGVWQGRRVIDAAWVAQSTARHSQFAADHRYGYAWHLHTFTANGHAYREYAAEGNGGQFVIVVPELDLAVVIMAGNYGEFRTWYPLQRLVPDYIIPAVEDAH